MDILDPVQTGAKGMDPAFLNATYGKKICFHGSIDTQYTLPKGTQESIELEVRDRLEKFGTDGFIIAPSHTVQPDVSVENIIFIYDAIKKYR